MKKIILSLAILAISLLSYAVPAKPGPKVITQKDVFEITVFAHGDEFHNYLTDKEGNLLLKNAEGIYVKANAEQIAKHKAQAKQADNQRKVHNLSILHQEDWLYLLISRTNSSNTHSKISTTCSTKPVSTATGQSVV